MSSMKRYRNKEVVEAVQYRDGMELDIIKIGVNDGSYRFDDTPNGPYIKTGWNGANKSSLKDGDWIAYFPEEKCYEVFPDVLFKKRYKLVAPKTRKSLIKAIANACDMNGMQSAEDMQSALENINDLISVYGSKK